MSLKHETEDLTVHVNVCAERYKGIQDQFENLEGRIDSVESKIDKIHSDIVAGHTSTRNSIIGGAIAIVVALIGLIATLL